MIIFPTRSQVIFPTLYSNAPQWTPLFHKSTVYLIIFLPQFALMMQYISFWFLLSLPVFFPLRIALKFFKIIFCFKSLVQILDF